MIDELETTPARRAERRAGGPVSGERRGHGRGVDAGGLVRLVLVQRLVLEQGARERLEALALALEQRDRLLLGLVDDLADLLVDQPLGVLGRLREPGSSGPRARTVRRRPRRSRRSSPAPTMLRAIRVSCWMSDSAPVVVSP